VVASRKVKSREAKNAGISLRPDIIALIKSLECIQTGAKTTSGLILELINLLFYTPSDEAMQQLDAIRRIYGIKASGRKVE